MIHSWEHKLRVAAQYVWDTLAVNWHLGFTSFGGPPVHFKIVSLHSNRCTTHATLSNLLM
jgi:hypothetical protein